MTAAPLPAPLPACPFCGADGEDLRVLPPTCTPKSPYNPADRAYPVLRCGGCGASVPGEDWDTLGASAVAAWNRRAPEAQAWRAIDEHTPRNVLSSPGDNGRRPVLVTRWPYVGAFKPTNIACLTTDGWMTSRHRPLRYQPTHWMPLPPDPAPPGATPAAPPAREAALVEALREIMEERRRQVEGEGWTPEHDDEHRGGEIAWAAACYAAPEAVSYTDTLGRALDPNGKSYPLPTGRRRQSFSYVRALRWPWDHAWWKPKDRRRNLVRAGALIVAEIERLDRAALAAADAGRARE